MDSTSARIAKRLLPAIASLVSSDTAQSTICYGEMAAAMLRGRGAGSGWDIAGETIAAMRFLRPGATVFDLGANLGEWSRAIKGELGDVRIFLFEPQADCADPLQDLVTEGAVLTRAAVGEKSGRLPLYTLGGTSGNASLHQRKDTYFDTSAMFTVAVDVVTLDEFIEANGISKVDFMKMDIEGNEPFALRGAIKALQGGTIRAMSFEFGSANINSRTYFRDMWDALTPHGYRLYRVLPGGKLARIKTYNEELEYFRGATNYIAAL